MTSHRAPETQTQQPKQATRHHGATWIERGRPDPFRAPGVPDRLVVVLHREGLHYVGKLAFWEYREIVVDGREEDGAAGCKVIEMVVDASMPHEFTLHMQMDTRPTAARVVDELIQVLRSKLGELAGREPNRTGEDLLWRRRSGVRKTSVQTSTPGGAAQVAQPPTWR